MPDDLDAARELATLYPSPQTFTIAGRAVAIDRCGIAQVGKIIDAGLPLYELVQKGANYLEFFETRPDEINGLLVAATGQPADWIASLDPVDKFELASRWMQVNAAFFVRRLLPSYGQFLAAMGNLGGGPT